jgi:uncharacterized protein YecT (DUF1311 family)
MNAQRSSLALCLLACCLLTEVPTQAAGASPAVEKRFAQADAKLNAVYGKLLKKLAPAAQAKLRQEERAWIADERERAAKSYVDAAGSDNPVTLLEGRAVATETRVEILQKQLDSINDPALPVPGGNYTGHYQRPDNPQGYDFGLEVFQTGNKAHVEFGATKTDGSGAAPVGEGEGQIDDAGVLTFTFEDSFSNKGTGTFALKKKGYWLDLDATQVEDPRCLRLYGEMILRRKGAPRKGSDR